MKSEHFTGKVLTFLILKPDCRHHRVNSRIGRDLTAGTRNFLANVVYAAAALLGVVTISSSVVELDAG